MKAYVLHNVNDLKYEDVPKPKCRDGWAIVKVGAAGICSSDIPRIYKKGTYHFPTIPGHEFCGVVKEVGNKQDEKWLNKRVGIFPLIPCKTCEQCLNHHYEMCSNYDYTGSRRDGGFAEYVEVPVWNLINLPNNISNIEAAMLEPLAVSLHAVKLANIKSDDKVAIIGTGMIGFAAAQWAKSFGSKEVDIYGRNNNKKKIAEALNLNYYTEQQKEYNVIIEAVGSIDSITKAIQMSRPGGKIILMGNPVSDIELEQSVYWKILRKQISLIGSWNSSYESSEKCDWTEACDAIAQKKINVNSLVSHIFPKERLVEGLDTMKSNKEPYCKVMTVWDTEENNNERE